MKIHTLIRKAQLLMICIIASTLFACESQEQVSPKAKETKDVTEEVIATTPEKIPLTTKSEDARKAVETGRALMDNLLFTESRPHFEKAIEFDPNFAMGYVWMANSAQSAEQFFDAIKNAEANAAGASEGEQLLINALAAGARNDQTAQLTALNSLVALHPKDERVHMLLGNYYNGQQNFDSAVTHFGHATEINPGFANAYNSLGYAQRANENLDAAKASFTKYVEAIPNEANPYDSLAELLMEMGDYDKAIENYRKALTIDSYFAASYNGIALSQSLKGDADAAQETAKSRLDVARTFAEKQGALYSVVVSHLLAANTDAAIASSKEIYAIAKADSNQSAMGNVSEYMGDIMLDVSDSAKALEFYDAALEHRQQANTNQANKDQASRAHLFKSAISAMVAKDSEVASTLTAKYIAAAEAKGNSFEKRRAHALAGYLAMTKEDHATAVTELAKGNLTNPVLLYWSAVANKNVGNQDAAKDLASRAANRNILNGNLPFARAKALKLLSELSMN